MDLRKKKRRLNLINEYFKPDRSDAQNKDSCDNKKRKDKHEENFDLSYCSKKDSHFESNLVILPIARPNLFLFNERNLCYQYGVIFRNSCANSIYDTLEKEIDYDKNSHVKIYGKTFEVPRKQKAFGNDGLTYTFSNVTVPTSAWIPILIKLKNILEEIVDCKFNFVLINRYKDGQDYMGEHQDNEKDLDSSAPIASLSFGQGRDFVFRHKVLRNSKEEDCSISLSKKKVLFLEHGSLLIMKPPTNQFWYHGLPKRSVKKCPNPRINLTFRKLVI